MKICIYTQESVEGKKAARVKEDRIIKTIRAIKQMFGIAQMNELYVSEEHLEEHMKRRKSFEKGILFASVLAGLIMVIVVVSLILRFRFDLWAIISAFIIGAFIMALPLFKYSPALESDKPAIVGPTAESPAAPAKKTKKTTKKKKR